jgi:hypothetical protein
MLRLPTILTAMIALGGLAATTQMNRSDAQKQAASETPDGSQASGTTSQAPGTSSYPGQSAQYASPLDSPAYSRTSGSSIFMEYFYEGTDWVRRHFTSMAADKARREAIEEARKARELATTGSVPHEDSFHREDPFHRADPFHREDPFHRADSFHHEDPFHRADPFHREDPFHRADPFHHVAQSHEDPFHHEDPSHREAPQTGGQTGYVSPLAQPARSTTSSTASGRPTGSAGRSGPVVTHAPAPQGFTH